jgi:hypothetical protein
LFFFKQLRLRASIFYPDIFYSLGSMINSLFYFGAFHSYDSRVTLVPYSLVFFIRNSRRIIKGKKWFPFHVVYFKTLYSVSSFVNKNHEKERKSLKLGAWRYHSPPPSAEVKDRVHQYLCSPCRSSWPFSKAKLFFFLWVFSAELKRSGRETLKTSTF